MRPYTRKLFYFDPFSFSPSMCGCVYVRVCTYMVGRNDEEHEEKPSKTDSVVEEDDDGDEKHKSSSQRTAKERNEGHQQEPQKTKVIQKR